MSVASVTSFDALAPVPDLTVLELAIVIVFARRPGIDHASLTAEIARWFKTDIDPSFLTKPLLRLVHRQWLFRNGNAIEATEQARERAEFAGRGIVQLIYRDRYFFDVAKLLDIVITRED